MTEMKPGDFVLIQFGHNDGGPLNTGRARASLKGNGDETQEVVMEATGKKEVVHTCGSSGGSARRYSSNDLFDVRFGAGGHPTGAFSHGSSGS